MIAAERDYIAIGHLATTLRCTVSSIERAATELGLSPAIRLNAVPYFEGSAAERIAYHMATLRDEDGNA